MSALRRQLSLDFSEPADHAGVVHAGTRHGTVLFWERAGEGRWLKCRPDDDLPAMAQAMRLSTDAYFSVNQFNGWRQVRLLRSLRAVYVDLDGQLDIEAALDALASAQMPAPSFAVFSGRGLHLYWLLQATPAQALPVWQRIQDSLIKTLEAAGSDPACRDCTRVLRLAGTVNSKNGAETRGLLLTGTEWDIHTLADEVLGLRRPGRPRSASVHDIEAAAARRAHAKSARKSVLQGSIYGWWHAVYSDLVRLTDLEFGNRLPEGQRDKLLFLHAVSLSWFAQPDAITDEILSVGRQITDFDDAEILQTMAPVIARRNQADAGHTIAWNGQDRDPRYFFKAGTLRDWIGHDLIERHADQLRALAPAEVIKERKAERDRARWGDHYTGTGVRASNEEKRASARLMRANRMTYKQISTALDVPLPTVARWCSD